MKTPKRIEPLIEDGLVDEVIRLGGIAMVRGNWAGYSSR